MNSLICFLSTFHFFKIIQGRFFVRQNIRNLIYLGIFLPVGDTILRFTLGEMWFQSRNHIFHSFIYQAIVWSIVVILHWTYKKDLKSSIRLYAPLIGLFIYFMFSFLSVESVTFFAPLSQESPHLDIINTGYLVPLFVALLLWGTKRWSEMSVFSISRLSLGFLCVFLLFVSILRYNVKNALTQEFLEASYVNITPANLPQTEWNVVAFRENQYWVGRYHFVQGWQSKTEKKQAFGDYDISRNILNDPAVRRLYYYAFKNPLIRVNTQSEAAKIEITELAPLMDVVSVGSVVIIKNRSGQIMDFQVSYNTLF